MHLLWADCMLIFLCFSQMGSQEQPRAMEQTGGQSTVQSMNSYPVFTQIYFWFSKLFSTNWVYSIFPWHLIHIFVVTMWQSPCCPCWMSVFVYVSSCMQLTWTTPRWRRTGLISKTCLRSHVPDMTRLSVWGALFKAKQTFDTEWSVNQKLSLTHSVCSFPAWRNQESVFCFFVNY